MRAAMAIPLLGRPWCPRFQGLEGASCTVAHSLCSFVGFSSMAWRVVALGFFFLIQRSALFWHVGSSVAVGVGIVDALALDLECLEASTSYRSRVQNP
jgi:hypothetical protein